MNALPQAEYGEDTSSGVSSPMSGAGVWQNKRTGLFNFIGEHNGRPLYKKNSTMEFLYYRNGSEWLVGPDFKKGNGGRYLACPKMSVALLNCLYDRYPVV